jgi:hypothetical protein
MKFTLTIDLDNAAFQRRGGLDRAELVRTLRIVAATIEDGKESGKVWDYNGNTVGSFAVEDDAAQGVGGALNLPDEAV